MVLGIELKNYSKDDYWKIMDYDGKFKILKFPFELLTLLILLSFIWIGNNLFISWILISIRTFWLDPKNISMTQNTIELAEMIIKIIYGNIVCRRPKVAYSFGMNENLSNSCIIVQLFNYVPLILFIHTIK